MKSDIAISVFGGYKQEVGDGLYETAEEVGRLIAERGWTLVNGGYSGSMEASARGAKAAGGRTVGVACEVFSREPNPYMDEIVPTSDLYERLRVLLDRGDGYVALPGATGTLAEVAMVWEFLAKGLMPQKPMALLGEFWQPLFDMLVPRPGVKAAAGGRVRVVASPAEAIDMLSRALTE